MSWSVITPSIVRQHSYLTPASRLCFVTRQLSVTTTKVPQRSHAVRRLRQRSQKLVVVVRPHIRSDQQKIQHRQKQDLSFDLLLSIISEAGTLLYGGGITTSTKTTTGTAGTDLAETLHPFTRILGPDKQQASLDGSRRRGWTGAFGADELVESADVRGQVACLNSVVERADVRVGIEGFGSGNHHGLDQWWLAQTEEPAKAEGSSKYEGQHKRRDDGALIAAGTRFRGHGLSNDAKKCQERRG